MNQSGMLLQDCHIDGCGMFLPVDTPITSCLVHIWCLVMPSEDLVNGDVFV